MNHERRPDRLRVDIPTLEPDDAFVGRLAHLSAASRPAHPRSTRSAGLRMAIAGGSVAVIATAAWAAGVPTGWEIPLSPADSPTQPAHTPAPGPGDVETPHSDVSTSPGSPVSPGLPGAQPLPTDQAKPSNPAATSKGKANGKAKGKKSHSSHSSQGGKSGKKHKPGSKGSGSKSTGNNGVGPDDIGNKGVGPKGSNPNSNGNSSHGTGKPN